MKAHTRNILRGTLSKYYKESKYNKWNNTPKWVSKAEVLEPAQETTSWIHRLRKKQSTLLTSWKKADVANTATEATCLDTPRRRRGLYRCLKSKPYMWCSVNQSYGQKLNIIHCKLTDFQNGLRKILWFKGCFKVLSART